MELVEAGRRGGRNGISEGVFFALYDLKKVDAVVLGCTHYVFLKGMIREMLPERIAITEGSEGTARQLKLVLARNRPAECESRGRAGLRLETSGWKDLEKMRSC